MRALTNDEISTALVSLGNWEHQDGVLARLAPTDDPDGLEPVVERVAGADGGHVAAVRTPNGVVLRVCDPDVGAVTAVDVEVAARIEQAIELGGADSAPPTP